MTAAGEIAGVATIDEQEFADVLGMTLAQVRRHLAGLEAGGWVARLPNDTDGSTSWALTLPPTDAGRR